jgi:hypothetical protein
MDIPQWLCAIFWRKGALIERNADVKVPLFPFGAQLREHIPPSAKSFPFRYSETFAGLKALISQSI